MKASKVKPGMKNLTLDLEVVEMGEPNSFNTDKGEGEVVTAVCKDDSGKVKVSLWNDEIDKVEVGDNIHIENGYSRLFRDEVHVSAGRYGELKVIK